MSRYDLAPSVTGDFYDPPPVDTSGPECCVRHGYDGCDCYTPPPAATVTIHPGADQ